MTRSEEEKELNEFRKRFQEIKAYVLEGPNWGADGFISVVSNFLLPEEVKSKTPEECWLSFKATDLEVTLLMLESKNPPPEPLFSIENIEVTTWSDPFCELKAEHEHYRKLLERIEGRRKQRLAPREKRIRALEHVERRACYYLSELEKGGITLDSLAALIAEDLSKHGQKISDSTIRKWLKEGYVKNNEDIKKYCPSLIRFHQKITKRE